MRRNIAVDQDTEGVPVSPSIAVSQKIRLADVFVADLTFIQGPTEREQVRA
jgi:hypothetical protein